MSATGAWSVRTHPKLVRYQPAGPLLPVSPAFVRARYAALLLDDPGRLLRRLREVAAYEGEGQEDQDQTSLLSLFFGEGATPADLLRLYALDACLGCPGEAAEEPAGEEWTRSASPPPPPAVRSLPRLFARSATQKQAQIGVHPDQDRALLWACSSRPAHLVAGSPEWVVFGRFGASGCPFSNRAAAALAAGRHDHACVQVQSAGQVPGCPPAHSTVPVVFRWGQFLGGCQELTAALLSGK